MRQLEVGVYPHWHNVDSIKADVKEMWKVIHKRYEHIRNKKSIAHLRTDEHERRKEEKRVYLQRKKVRDKSRCGKRQGSGFLLMEWSQDIQRQTVVMLEFVCPILARECWYKRQKRRAGTSSTPIWHLWHCTSPINLYSSIYAFNHNWAHNSTLRAVHSYCM